MRSPKLIIGIMMHDTGRNFGCYGTEWISSPNIDKISREGVIFRNHFSTGTVCVPSRASILTGRYFHNAELCRYRENEPSLPRSLSDAGYKCWRLGFAEEGEYASPAGSVLPYANKDESGTKLLGYDFSWTESPAAADVADKLISVLSENTEEKLYICASFREAHSPYTAEVTEEEIAKVQLPKDLPDLPDHIETKRLLAQFARLVSDGDRAVGRIIDYINENGLYDDCLLWFSADHGFDLPRAKQTCYDRGTETPLILWGGMLPQKGIEAAGLSSHLDIAPTICRIAGATPPKGYAGVSQYPQLEGEASPRSFCVSEQSRESKYLPVRSIRTERYRYIRNFKPGYPVPMAHTLARRVDKDLLTKAYSAPRPEEELYDVVLDPAQKNNLAYDPEYSEIRLNLMAELYSELARTNDELFWPCEKPQEVIENPLSFWKRDENGNFYLSEQK